MSKKMCNPMAILGMIVNESLNTFENDKKAFCVSSVFISFLGL
jgi:hypothetical protein